jgi:hypothetical protein
MPTIYIEGYRFRFYSSDRNEPPHMHVLRGGNEAKIWLEPVEAAYNRGYNQAELARICRLTEQNLICCWRTGMITSDDSVASTVAATAVRFEDDELVVVLSDGRRIHLPLRRVPWLKWLAEAAPAQRSNWSIEPNGFAIYWDELEDGIEVAHLLDHCPPDR